MYKNEHRSIILHTTQSKHIKNINIRLDTWNLIEEKIENKLELIGKNFMNRTPKAQAIRPIIDNQELMKLKSYCKEKNTTILPKWLPTKWKNKIITNYKFDSRLGPRIQKKFKAEHK
jgi:hypothetical protein